MNLQDQSLSLQDGSNSPESEAGVSRRRFLSVGAATALALALPKSAKAGALSPIAHLAQADPCPSCAQFTLPLCPVTFRNPPALTCNGSGVYTLDVKQLSVNNVPSQNGPVTLTLRTFNCQIPGQTIYVNPGDKIRIKVNNCLVNDGTDQCPPSQHNAPSCFNKTNMHFHGLHVSPASICNEAGEKILSSDDVLYVLESRANTTAPPVSHDWCVWLPKFHAPGTHWYHSHRHGSTAIQVSNGMAGAIIIQEPPEQRLVTDDADHIWLLQELLANPYAGGTSQYLVNGQLRPILTFPAGKLQRLRFINATSTPRGLINLKLCKVSSTIPSDSQICQDTSITCDSSDLQQMYLMAVDGISFYCKAPQPVQNWNMAPGNRADFLVKLEPGLYKVIQGSYQCKDGRTCGPGSTNTQQVLGYLKVTSSTFNDPIPTVIPGTPPQYLLPINPSELNNSGSPRVIDFSLMQPQQPGGFKVNGQAYEDNRVDIDVNLGTAEVWQLQNSGITNRTTAFGSVHPFHIHVNPFQLVGDKIDPNGPDDSTNWRWWDTMAVEPPTASPGVGPVLQIWQRFIDYPGEFVFHCHILLHEDQGMMQNVRINSTPQNPGIPPCTSSDGQSDIPPGGKPCYQV